MSNVAALNRSPASAEPDLDIASIFADRQAERDALHERGDGPGAAHHRIRCRLSIRQRWGSLLQALMPIAKLGAISPRKGAETILHLASAPEVASERPVLLPEPAGDAEPGGAGRRGRDESLGRKRAPPGRRLPERLNAAES
jgi:hypothetical protein